MDLATAVDELYAADLPDFIATRRRLVAEAKERGDADVAAELPSLRKPTAVAWLLNRVARDEPRVVADLLDLGERMRTAQAKGDGAALAAARPERRESIEALVAAARRCADATGTTFTAAAADGVGDTAVAVLADPASGEALASGRLLRPLTYAGFGEVELDDAVALLRLVPPVADGDAADADGDDEMRAHERELTAARDALRESERELGAARLARSEAQLALEAARAEVERLTAEVARDADHVAALETRPDGGPASDRDEGAGSWRA
ncbi:MAG: hypothetical protein ACTMHL_01095 [Janibacter sp.]